MFFSDNYVKIKTDAVDDLPIEKTSTLHVVIVIKSVYHKNSKSLLR